MASVRYTKTRDGVSIAWKRSGQGIPLIVVPNLISRLDYDDSCPIWAHWDAFLENHFDYIRYDMRGSGLSERSTIKPPEGDHHWCCDLEAVIKAAKLQTPFILFGWSQGAMTAFVYASRHPQQVSQIITYEATSLGGNLHPMPEIYHFARQVPYLALARNKPSYMALFIASLLPVASKERLQWMEKLIRRSYSPQAAIDFFDAIENYSTEDLLPDLDIPMLLLHARDDDVIPFYFSERIARITPTAELVPLDSANHIIDLGDPGWPQFCNAILRFTANAPELRQPAHDHSPPTRPRRPDDEAKTPGPAPGDTLESLTPREQAILRLICTGISNKEIGRELDISEKTVRNHISNIFVKTDVKNRREAIIRFARVFDPVSTLK